jgi:hypothetical protein
MDSWLIKNNPKVLQVLLPAAMKMCEIMHGEEYGEALKTAPPSSNTVMRRTGSMS